MSYVDNFVQTFSGKKFSLFHPDPESIDLHDIAHALSMQCRFNGHTKRFLSVAEHSWWVSHLVKPEYALTALMHDAGEAYISDIPKPFKLTLGYYIELIEQQVLDALGDKLGFDSTLSSEIKDADVEMLVYEREQALHPSKLVWSPYIESFVPYLAKARGIEVELNFWTPEYAKNMFLARYAELTA